MRHNYRPFATVLLLFAAVAAAAPNCLLRYAADLRDVTAAERKLLLTETGRMGRDGQRGLELFLEYRNLQEDAIRRLASTFKTLRSPSVKSRFSTPEDFFAALTRINSRAPNGIVQEGRVLADIGQLGPDGVPGLPGNPGLAQGSLMEVYVADVDGATVASFRSEIRGNGQGYFADIVYSDGRRREVKAYFQPLVIPEQELINPIVIGDVFQYSDARASSLAEETTRILLTNEGNLQAFGFEFALELSDQNELIEQFLLQQALAPRIANVIGPARAATLRDEFEALLPGMIKYK